MAELKCLNVAYLQDCNDFSGILFVTGSAHSLVLQLLV